MSLVRCKKCGAIVSNRFQNCTECNAIIDIYKSLQTIEKIKSKEKQERKINPIIFLVILLVLIGGVFVHQYVGTSTINIPIIEPIMVAVPKDTKSYEGKNAYEVKEELCEAGFTNIVLVEEEREKIREKAGKLNPFREKYQIRVIYFDGNISNVRKGEEYPSNIKIKICYFKEK